MLAQSQPPECPADRPVDDIIIEVHNQQSKKKHRNPNPFPEVTCIFGWCRDNSRTPPTIPQPAPRAETPSAPEANSSYSSSKIPVDRCNAAMEMALEAAHNVEVGDYYFGERNYRAALLRFQDAVEQKPNDAAIHVRLGRVLEKLNELPQAIEQYKAGEKLAAPEKWSQEARAALARLQRQP